MKTKLGVCCLMSLGLIATAVAIVRASSLGIKTADLSYDYCIAAIWANTELHLGIIATNLALSRMIWGFFVGASTTLSTNARTPRYGTGSHLSRNTRHGYTKSSDFSPYTNGVSETQISVDNASRTSQIPLDPIIKKTTSVRVTYKAADADDMLRSDETLSGHQSEVLRLDTLSRNTDIICITVP
jgi:hypothetical protein